MLVRVLTMQVVPERLDDWFRFTRDVGFPGMRRQPGCRGIWRLHKHGAAHDYQVVTLWDSLADLEAFRAGARVQPHGDGTFVRRHAGGSRRRRDPRRARAGR